MAPAHAPTRPAVVATPPLGQALRQQLQQGQEALQHTFRQTGNARRYLQGRSQLIDRVLHSLWQALAPDRGACLLACGGYGRRELYPCSDIDLLILLPEPLTQDITERTQTLIAALWDLELTISQSVHSVHQSLLAAHTDLALQTSWLEARRLAGSPALHEQFQQGLRSGLKTRLFFAAKCREQSERQRRFDDSAANLEPNCKDGPGGLRDLHTLRWLGLAAGLPQGWAALVRQHLLTASEARQLQTSERFLQRLRIHLHLLSGRPDDRVRFDYQITLAQQLCYASATAASPAPDSPPQAHEQRQRSDERRAAERLMQHYYRHTRRILQLGGLLQAGLQEQLWPTTPAAAQALDEHFVRRQDLLDIRDEQVFQRQPDNILKAFLWLARTPQLTGMSARCLRALWRARPLVNARFRQQAAHQALFLQLFQHPGQIAAVLQRMNQYELLGRYLPPFARIVGQRQHDLFHVHTVDQHSLQVIHNLERHAQSAYADEFPLCARLINQFARPWLLYLAALFHDIAKGRGGDHALLGQAEARRFWRTHGLAAEDGALLEFLVAEHLSLSRTAQQQDLADPEVIAAFAAKVGTLRQLQGLYLLTCADIRATNPAIWNQWKENLLSELYQATAHMLTGAAEPSSIATVRQDEARQLLQLHGLPATAANQLWQRLDTQYFLRHTAADIAWHSRVLLAAARTQPSASSRPLVAARPNPAAKGLQVMVHVADQPRLFARLCAYFAGLGYSIVDARIYTTRDAHALDTFILVDPTAQLPARDMIALIEQQLAEHLQQRPALPAPQASRPSRQMRHFPIQPEVHLEACGTGGHYLLSLAAADRPGLLYSIALSLARHDIQLHTAKITTLGERAEDSFLISGAALQHTPQRLKLEQDLLATLQLPLAAHKETSHGMDQGRTGL